jgi:hypothetical protein
VACDRRIQDHRRFLHQKARQGLELEERGRDVDGELSIDFVELDFLDGLEGTDPCVEERHIDAASSNAKRLGECFGGVGTSRIVFDDLDVRTQFAPRCGERVGVSAGDRDGGSFVSKSASGR